MAQKIAPSTLNSQLSTLNYIALAVLVVAIVSWWRLGIIALGLFALVTLIRVAILRQWGNPFLGRGQRLCLLLMIAYWLLLAVSALYSHNHAEGWSTAATQLPLLVLPLLCLVGDTSYLSRDRIRTLFRLMTAALVLRFGVCIVVDIVQYCQGVPWTKLRNWEFDPLGLHHNYLAIYIDCALAFLYCDWAHSKFQVSSFKFQVSSSNQSPSHAVAGNLKSAICKFHLQYCATAAVLVAYLLISSSRSGVVTLGVLFLGVLLHQTFCRHRWKMALCAAGLAIVLAAGACLAFPQMAHRFTYLFTEMAAGRQGDDRPMLIRCGLEAAAQRPAFGHGTGDYMEVLMERYEANGFAKGLSHHYDAHNQYMETLVAEGTIGLTLLLAMLLAPVVISWRTRRNRLLVTMVLAAAMLQLFFESMLDRQMGVQFVALLYLLIILLPNGSCNKAASELQP